MLVPGNSLGTITFNQGLTLAAGSGLDLDLGAASDLVRVTAGTLTGANDHMVGADLNLGSGFQTGTRFTPMDWTARRQSAWTRSTSTCSTGALPVRSA